MSIKIMSWLWENSPHKGSELLLLLAIADSANDDGVAWPGLAKLSKKTRLGRRYVIDLVDQLEKAGAIKVERRRQGELNLSNIYMVVVPNSPVVNLSSLGSEPQTTTPNEPQATRVVVPNSPESSLNHKSEPSKKQTAAPDFTNEILVTWKALFPEKPQPKPETIRDKLKARLKNADFAANWKAALEHGAVTEVLHTKECAWFNLTFFLRNDENFQKVLDGWMDWKSGNSNGNGAHTGVTPPANAGTGNGSAMRL